MATAQQLIDAKYSQQLALNDQKLHEIFSNVILGWGLQKGLKTFEDLSNFNGILDLSNRNLKILTGVDYLTALTSLNLYSNQLTDIGDLSGLTALTSFNVSYNQLTDVGDLSGFTALTYLYIQYNQLTDIGDLSGLTALVSLQLYSNQLTDIGDLSGLTALVSLRLDSNQLTTAQVDAKLSEMHTAYDATGKIATINLSGSGMGVPTNGINNADYVYLTNAGVSVTINS